MNATARVAPGRDRLRRLSMWLGVAASIMAAPALAATAPSGPAAEAVGRWFMSDRSLGCFDRNANAASCGPVNTPDFSVFYGNADGGGGKPDAVVVVTFLTDPTGNAMGTAAAAFRQDAGGRYRFVRRLDAIEGSGIAPGSPVRFGGGKAVVTMMVLRPTDGRCCPTGRRQISLDLR